MHIHSPNKGKLHPRVVKCIFVGYASTQKGYKCCHPLSIFFFFVLVDVTFNESESYFPASYLQGENSIKEDKDRDSSVIDPFLIDFFKVSDPVVVPFIDPTDPPKMSDLLFVPFYEPESSIELALGNQMTDKVYSRKKVAVPQLMQVQESKPTSGNELIVPHPLLQTELELQSEKPMIKTFPLPLGRERGNALNVLCIHFPMLCHSKNSLNPIRVFLQV